MLLLDILRMTLDADSLAAVVACVAEGLVPVSYVAISHMTADFAPDAARPAPAACAGVDGVVGPGGRITAPRRACDDDKGGARPAGLAFNPFRVAGAIFAP